jgi:hypothetical protein
MTADLVSPGARIYQEKIHPAKAKGDAAIAGDSADHLRRFT